MRKNLHFVRLPYVLALAILLLSTHLTTFSQTVCMIDSTTHQPIDAVNVFNSKGDFLGITDSNGLLKLPNDTLHIDSIACTHISYIECYTQLNAAIDTVCLQPRIVTIPNIDVQAPKADYTVLHAYFRSYQYDDHELCFFADGVVDYYVPKKSSKDFRFRTKEYRYFQHKKFKSIEDCGRKDLNEMPMFFGGPKEFATMSHYPKKSKHVDFQTTKIGDMLHVNHIETKVDSAKTLWLPFGFRFRVGTTKVKEVLLSHRSDHTWRREDLISFSSFQSLEKKVGRKNKFTTLHTYNEVFVFDKEIQSKKQVRKVKKVHVGTWNKYGTCIGMQDPIDFSKYNIPKVPVFIERKLGHDLVKYNKETMMLF